MLAALGLAAALLGGLWEELWRGATWTGFSLYPQGAPFLLVVVVVLVFFAVTRLGREGRGLCVGTGALSLAALPLMGWEAALFLCAILMCVLVTRGMVLAAPARSVRPGEVNLLCAVLVGALAAGMVVGVVAVNNYASQFTAEKYMLEYSGYYYGRLVEFTSSASYVLGALFLACGVALVAVLSGVVG